MWHEYVYIIFESLDILISTIPTSKRPSEDTAKTDHFDLHGSCSSALELSSEINSKILMNWDCELVIKVEIKLTSSMHSAKILGTVLFFIGDWLVTVNWGVPLYTCIVM